MFSKRTSKKGKRKAVAEGSTGDGQGTDFGEECLKPPGGKWDENHTVLFIQIMHDSWKDGGIDAGNFKPQSWTTITKRMNDEGLYTWGTKQLQTKLTRLKSAYKKHMKAKYGETGWGKNPVTGALEPPPHLAGEVK